MIIAIDGPAGSGKSTTAREVSRALGFLYVDTGAMYRAFGLAFLESGSDDSPEAIETLLARTNISLNAVADGHRVTLNGKDVSELIRTPEVSEAASKVAKLTEVRQAMVQRQRSLAASAVESGRGAVLEGRDIGTVVFPDADLKIFLDADLDERARRRRADLATDGVTPTNVREQLARRDSEDQHRDIAPLLAADDAIKIDTTALTFEQQVGQIVGLARDLIH